MRDRARLSAMHIARFLPLALATAACAHDGYQHLDSLDGRALAVAPTTTQVPEVRNTVIRDASGATLGTESTITGWRTVTSGYQLQLGDAPIDERDFYHLAGKRDEEDAIASARRKGKVMNLTGFGVMAASLTTAIAVPILFGRSAAKYSVGQAFITFPIGMGLAFFGQRRVERQNYSAVHAFKSLDQASPDWAVRLEER